MNKNFAIIGGDLRIVKLAKLLVEENNNIAIYGLEKSEELNSIKKIKKCGSLSQAIENSDTIVAPIPFSSDGVNINTPFSDEKIAIKKLLALLDGKKLIAGSLRQEVVNELSEKNIDFIDVMKMDELAVSNAIATAEGTIELIISNTQINIHGSKILILGFGRVGKVLAQKLKALSAYVTCAVRKKQDLAWIDVNGYNSTDINKLGKELSEFDVIINTVPSLILTDERLKYIKEDSLLIDLASRPGGIDIEAAERRKIKTIWALALPGKVSPVSTAKYIKWSIEM